jgi:tRNA G18 (ribose-2'-O)-methylase SpoU
MGSYGAEEKQVEAKEEESSSAMGENGNGIELIVIVHNVAKRHNVGTMARSATAFGAAEIVLAGRRDFNCFGSHGSASHLRFRHFPSLTQACTYLKEQRGADICGVEIREDAVPLTTQQPPPFRRSTAFLLGNEGTGLSPRECAVCDFFVYIPQYGPGTASLNVTVAASIVLHHFAVWAGFSERPRNGGKFLVADRPAAHKPSPESVRALVEERRLKRENHADLLELEDPDSNPTNLLESIFDE